MFNNFRKRNSKCHKCRQNKNISFTLFLIKNLNYSPDSTWFFLGFVYTLMTLFGVGGPPYFRGVSWPVVEDFNPQDLLLQPRQVLNIDWTTTERRRNSRNCATWRPLVLKWMKGCAEYQLKCSDNVLLLFWFFQNVQMLK